MIATALFLASVASTASSQIKLLTTPARALQPVELELALNLPAENPFDPRQILVDADIQGPSQSWSQPCFWYKPCERLPGGDVRETGPGSWRLRFTPLSAGTWSLKVKAVSGKKRQDLTEFKVEVSAPSSAGKKSFIGLSKDNPRFFAWTSGETHFPVGLNLCWSERKGLDDYQEWLDAMQEAGADWARIWMITWHLALEGGEDAEHRRPGVYNMDNAWKVDELFRMARERGVNLQLCLDSFNILKKSKGNEAWVQSAYSAENGGPLHEPKEFWTNAEAKRLYRQRLRYLVARYAAYPNLFAWEHWNEVDGTDQYDPDLVIPWHAEMARELRRLDPYKHLITSSGGSVRMDRRLWELPEMDYAQIHMYDMSDTALPLTRAVGDLGYLNKPVIVGEFGANVDEGAWIESKGDSTGIHLKTALWAVSLSGSAGTPMIWYWGNYVHRYGLWKLYKALSPQLRNPFWIKAGFQAGPPPRLSFANPALGSAYRQILIKPDDPAWGGKQKTVELKPDGSTVPSSGISHFFYGDGKPEFKSALVLKGDFKEAAVLRLRVNVVSSRALLRVQADGKTVLEKDLVPGAGQGEWKTVNYQEEWKVYQNVYDRDYEAKIPGGTKEIRVENAAGDWMTFSALTLDPYLEKGLPPLDCYGVHDKSQGLYYLKRRDYAWNSASLSPCPASLLTFSGFSGSQLSATLIDPETGKDMGLAEFQRRGADWEVKIPPLSADLALALSSRP